MSLISFLKSDSTLGAVHLPYIKERNAKFCQLKIILLLSRLPLSYIKVITYPLICQIELRFKNGMTFDLKYKAIFLID